MKNKPPEAAKPAPVNYPRGHGPAKTSPPEAARAVLGPNSGIVEFDPHPTLTIVLPLPPGELHPNTPRVHWAAKARKVKEYRAIAHATALPLTVLSTGPYYFARPVLTATFLHATARRRDVDGAISSIKAACDGLTDAAAWADDSLVTWGAVEFAVDRQNPRVEITVREREGETE